MEDGRAGRRAREVEARAAEARLAAVQAARRQAADKARSDRVGARGAGASTGPDGEKRAMGTRGVRVAVGRRRQWASGLARASVRGLRWGRRKETRRKRAEDREAWLATQTSWSEQGAWRCSSWVAGG